MRCPSRETTLSLSPSTEKSSPVIMRLLSLSAMEKIVCWMISFRPNSEICTGLPFSSVGRYEKSSPDLPMMWFLVFLQVIVVLKSFFVSMTTSLSGSSRTMSKKSFASRAMTPCSSISPSTAVSIPSSKSFAIMRMTSVFASIKMHSRIDMVVLLGTAFETMLIPRCRFALEQIIFMLLSLPQSCALAIVYKFMPLAAIYHIIDSVSIRNRGRC